MIKSGYHDMKYLLKYPTRFAHFEWDSSGPNDWLLFFKNGLQFLSQAWYYPNYIFQIFSEQIFGRYGE